MIRKAVIPAAGLGTGFLPATKSIPKEMLPIIDKPIIHYVVEEAVASGLTDILIVTGKGKRAVEDYFDSAIELETILIERGEMELVKILDDTNTEANIYFTRQKHPEGLGDAVLLAESFVAQEPFAVLLGDNIVVSENVPCTKQLIDIYYRLGGISTIASIRIDKEQSRTHGVIDYEMDEDDARLFKVKKQVEKPEPSEAPSNIATIGRYVYTPKIFSYIKVSGHDNDQSLTEATNRLALDEGVYSYLIDGIRYDTGDKKGYVKAIMDFAKKRGLI